MFEHINRPYKESSPEETIERLRNILGNLNLLPDQTFFANPYPQIYSVSLELSEGKGAFRANGKGRTKEYSLASAYAEFLERMQNGLYGIFSRTIMNLLKEEYGFYYSPDERHLTEDEFLRLPEQIITDVIHYTGENRTNFVSYYFERLRVNRVPGVVSVPFYDTKNKRETYLPLNLLLLTVGSNGMAAGNTTAEAVFQAVCELLERWGAAQVFYNQLTPPTIPVKFLEQFEQEYEIIKNIEKTGKYNVTVKDFSANKRIPSLGIIIENLETQSYRLNVGSDTCFQVALSRCLTEVYQGFEDDARFDQRLLPIPKEEAEYFVENDEHSFFQRSIVFSEFTKNNSGVFPKSLFATKPDYPFDPEVFTTQESYEKEVRFLISYLHRLGYNVYIRDVSFLGFPSVFVYIPEISPQGKKNAPLTTGNNAFNIIELDKNEAFLFNVMDCSDKELISIARTLNNFNGNASITDLLNVRLKQTSPWKQLNVSFLLTQIWYKLGMLEKARKTFCEFLNNLRDENIYYKIVYRYLQLKAEGNNEKKILKRIMEEVDDVTLVKQVDADLSDPNEIFQFIKLPSCPNCARCQLYEDCLTTRKIGISRILYPVMEQNIIDERDLSWSSE